MNNVVIELFLVSTLLTNYCQHIFYAFYLYTQPKLFFLFGTFFESGVDFKLLIKIIPKDFLKKISASDSKELHILLKIIMSQHKYAYSEEKYRNTFKGFQTEQ